MSLYSDKSLQVYLIVIVTIIITIIISAFA